MSAYRTLHYVVPKVHGQPDAARGMAGAYRDLAAAVATAARQVQAVVAATSAYWSGRAQQSADEPVEQLLHDAAALVRVLDRVADELDAYAQRLERAHQHHGFSLHKLVKIGAIVAVSGAAMVVTLGAAGAVEAAAASAAVADATEAAATASAASAGAAAGFFDALDVMATLRPLLQFVLPRLYPVEWSAGAVAVYDEGTRDALDWRGIEVTSGLTVVGGGLSGRVAAATEAAPPLLSHGLQAGVWAGISATDDEILTGRIDGLDVVESFVLAHGGMAAHDALETRGLVFHETDYRRAALVDGLRQPGRIRDVEIAREMALIRPSVDDLRRGEVDLYVHEGPGHTMARHLGQTATEMRARLGREPRVRRISTFWTEADARDAIAAALRQNPQLVSNWLADAESTRLRLRARLPYDLGMAIDRRGRVTFPRSATVVLRRDATGVYVLTGFPRR